MKIRWIDTDQEDIEMDIKMSANHPKRKALEHLLSQLEGFVIGIKDNLRYKILYKDVYYIENHEDMSTLYTKSEAFTSPYRLYEFVELSPYFVRIHKSFVVNLLKIKSFKSSLNGKLDVTLINGDRLEISRNYVNELKEKLKGGSL
jgi:DNA-binding LytR/AlgR family response regulator